jgi:hypothetical protein
MRRVTVHAKGMSKSQCSTFVYDVAHDRVHRTTDHVKHATQDSRDTGLVEIFLQCSNSDIASIVGIRPRMIP